MGQLSDLFIVNGVDIWKVIWIGIYSVDIIVGLFIQKYICQEEWLSQLKNFSNGFDPTLDFSAVGEFCALRDI